MKIPLSGSVAGFAGDIACSTFTTSSSKPLPFRFDGCATSIFRTGAAGIVSGSGVTPTRKPQSGASAKWKLSSGSATRYSPATFLPPSPVLTEGAMITYAPKWIGVHERSARGHLQTFGGSKRKSALTPKADVRVTHVMSDMGQ